MEHDVWLCWWSMCLGVLVEHVSECACGACVWVSWWSMMSECTGGA